MSVPTCNHLKEDGVYCGSPALSGRHYCYFHLNLHARHLKAAQARRRGASPALYLPFPEDMHAVQIGLAEIMWALADDRIETKKAWALLNTLQQASSNLTKTPNWQGQREAVPEHRPLRAINDPGFERRHGLPNDADLDAGCADDLGCPSPTGCPTPASVAGVGLSDSSLETENSKLETPPDRVPFPEDEFANLKITHWEEMEFFLYRCHFDDLDEDREDEFKLRWLREKRRVTQLQYEDAQNDASLENAEHPLPPMDGPDYDDKHQPPFGFGNSLESFERAEEEAEAAA